MNEEVQKFLSDVETDKSFSTNTVAAYGNDLTQFWKYVVGPPDEDRQFAVAQWRQLTPDHLQRYVVHLRMREYAPSTIARKTAAVKSFCHFLTEQGIFPSDPATELSSPKVGKYSPKPVPPDQVARLLAQTFSSDQVNRPEMLRDQAMLETLYATGMRVSELVALDTDDVNTTSWLIHCRGRAGRARDLPLSAVWECLSRYVDQGRPKLATKDETALFVNQRGSRLTRQGFWLILKSYAEAAGVNEITPHALRHAFAWNALHSGASLRQVQEMLGHVSISTTKVYRRVDPANQGEGANGVEKPVDGTALVGSRNGSNN